MYSERFQRESEDDESFRKRIFDLLNDVSLNSYDYVDAYYYDYSALPEHLKDKFYRDMYLLFAINHRAEFVTKWVERWDLDCDHPVVNGEVIRPKC